ncbi:MAG TPA: LuxR C-terminal-related transcriptional regulator [Candidatus Angelobacter sp.]|nr:LuxR C-terminal-related transcriptional regulator [Candidatus Angelobacter sp.]
MEQATTLAHAHDAYRRRDWAAARHGFEHARETGLTLDGDALYALCDAAWWLGDVRAHLATAEEAFRAFELERRPTDAAMTAMFIAISHSLRGDQALASGWMSRCERLLTDGPPDSVERGYVLYLTGVDYSEAGDPDAMLAAARRVQEIGLIHADANLRVAGMVGEGRALLRLGEAARGLALLDEAMVAITTGELSPEWSGDLYCNLMDACHQVADLARAAQWVAATERWLDTMPAAVLFAGICRVHRARVDHARGDWTRSETEARRVCEDLAGISVANVAEAEYQLGDVQRLRGDLAAAEAAYRRAHAGGRDPQPGLALLRLAQGRVPAASSSIDTALLAAAGDALASAPLLEAQVEISLAAGDLAAAEAGARALSRIAAQFGTSGLLAMAARCDGAVAHARGDAASALPILRDAARRWQELGVPYETARTRVLLAEVSRSLGDEDAATMELDAADEVFRRLGARLDAERASALRSTSSRSDGLTDREVEVLAHVASGKTNREIAAALVISDKTVARHLSNIFTKLDLPSRTAAAAYAFEHGIASTART